MDNEDVFTFCQSDLPCISFAAFEDMRAKGQFCDLTLKVQNHSFVAHRMIVAAAIPYFQSAFTSSGAECEEKEIAVQDLDPKALESLIHFAYSSKVNISFENVNSLLVASHFLQLNRVRDACVQFLTERFSISNVTQIRAFACSISNSSLVENCDIFLRKNFDSFAKCADFSSLPYSCIKAVISEDDLNVPNEEVVFEAVIKWIQDSPDERKEMLQDLLGEVRMVYISNEYLLDKICSEELVRKSLPCRDLVEEVKSYHLLPQRKSLLSNLKETPRNRWRHMYAVGFCTECGLSVHYFDLMKKIWRPLSVNNAEKSTACGIVGVNEDIYIFLEETIQTFSIKSQEWQVLIPRHEEMDGAAIVSNANRIYCFGSSDSNFSSKVRCFDVERHEWLEERKMESNRCYSAAVSVGDFIYVTGGYDRRGWQSTFPQQKLSTVAKYIPSTGQWDEAASMLSPRSHHGCTTLDGKIYVSGGWDIHNSEMNTAEVYDPLTDQWTFISSMNNKMYLCTLVSYCNELYAFQSSTCEVYDPKTDQWKTCSFALETFHGAVCLSSTC